jgi:hypothetical protein
MEYILSIVSKLLEINSWNAVMLDEQPSPVFVYKDDTYTWSKPWYEDLKKIIQYYMGNKKNIIKKF